MTTITAENFIVKIGKYRLYRCPICKNAELRDDYKFCPMCGEKIKFKILEKNSKKQ